jgi:hypothetical protein
MLTFFGTPLVIEPLPDQLSGDAGLLPIRPFDKGIGRTRAFAEVLENPREPDLTEHTFQERAHASGYGILAGYEGPKDHPPEADPVFLLLADYPPVDLDRTASPPGDLVATRGRSGLPTPRRLPSDYPPVDLRSTWIERRS